MNITTLAGHHKISAPDLRRLIDEGGMVWLTTTGNFPRDLRCAYSASIPKFGKESKRRVLLWKVTAGGEMIEQLPQAKAKA